MSSGLQSLAVNQRLEVNPMPLETRFHKVRNPSIDRSGCFGRILKWFRRSAPERSEPLECNVCFEPLSEQDERIGNCAAHQTRNRDQEYNENRYVHYFHTRCIARWAAQRRLEGNAFKCPICNVAMVDRPPLDNRPREYKLSEARWNRVNAILSPLTHPFSSANLLASGLLTTGLGKVIETTLAVAPSTAIASASVIGALATAPKEWQFILKAAGFGLAEGIVDAALGNWTETAITVAAFIVAALSAKKGSEAICGNLLPFFPLIAFHLITKGEALMEKTVIGAIIGAFFAKPGTAPFGVASAFVSSGFANHFFHVLLSSTAPIFMIPSNELPRWARFNRFKCAAAAVAVSGISFLTFGSIERLLSPPSFQE